MTDKVPTKETLAQYNGQDGQPAYVAVDGVVYDLFRNRPWQGGKHFKGLTAGRDLSEFFAKSHHTPATLNKPFKSALTLTQQNLPSTNC